LNTQDICGFLEQKKRQIEQVLTNAVPHERYNLLLHVLDNGSNTTGLTGIMNSACQTPGIAVLVTRLSILQCLLG
jgi:hypothetical protein